MVTGRIASLLVVAALVAACSSSSPAVAQAGAQVDVETVQPGVTVTTANGCPAVGEDSGWNVGGANLTPVPTGGTYGGSPITVTCTVHQSGNSYSVEGYVYDAAAGSFTLTGTVTTANGVPQPASNVNSTFVLPAGLGTWSYNACTITFPDSWMGIASGRVWGVLDCSAMVDTQHQTTCDGTATFRLENCTE